MTESTTEDRIESIAEEQREEMQPASEGWPDCFDISRELAKILPERIDAIDVRIVRFNISGFEHYAVEVGLGLATDTILVDATFDQFATETDTPFQIHPRSDIESVITVKPAQRYIFSDFEVSLHL